LAIRGPSFRWLDAASNLPCALGCKPFLALAALAAALAGCGGGGDEERRTVAGPGFTFSAPADWEVELRGRSGSASPEAGATKLVSVRLFRLARPYRPALWETVVPELDRVAAELAQQLDGRIDASATVVVDGRRAKRYDIRYDRDGTEIVERTAFVLKGRREFQLVCRYEAADEDDGPRACAMLFSSLTLE
jgi:hypothetical protein